MKWSRWFVALLLAAWTVGCASLPSHVDRTPSQAFAAPAQTALGQLVAQRRAQDHPHSPSGFVLLDGVDSAFAARVALVRSAQHTLDLQYYAIHADSTTEVLLEEMRKAARRGVRIRLLLDDFNTVGKDAQVLRLAFEPNVQIRLFNPLPGSRESLLGRVVVSLKDVQRIAKRMHNKMFIADAAIGITGGRNLGDAYFGGDGKSSFVDIDVLAAGPIVQDMETCFDRYWNDELAYPMQSLVTASELEHLRKPADEASKDASHASPVATAAASQPAPVRPGTVLPNVAPSMSAKAEAQSFELSKLKFIWAPTVLLQDKPGKVGPDDDEANAGDTVVDGLLELIDGAKHDVLIVSPYFVPGPPMMEQFRRLKERGVRVRVLTNSLASNDAPAAHAGYARHRKELIESGVEIHEMHASQTVPGAGLGSAGGGSKVGTSHASLHSKAVVIDGRLSVIGSMNLDLRSKTKNSEVALVVRSAAFAKDVTARIETMIRRGAYHVVLDGHRLQWRAPPGAGFPDGHDEPGATFKQRALAAAVAVFAPDEML
jgi:phosphatidylserine/phosphatidylglycerophosphate/cardiolipin synthase-like enzyme